MCMVNCGLYGTLDNTGVLYSIHGDAYGQLRSVRNQLAYLTGAALGKAAALYSPQMATPERIG
jgi:hypothetical protein